AAVHENLFLTAVELEHEMGPSIADRQALVRAQIITVETHYRLAVLEHQMKMFAPEAAIILFGQTVALIIAVQFHPKGDGEWPVIQRNVRQFEPVFVA